VCASISSAWRDSLVEAPGGCEVVVAAVIGCTPGITGAMQIVRRACADARGL
jgi:hypothetical protein